MSSSHWRDDYLASLQEAERNNPVNKDLVDACSQLADRVAALEAEKTARVTDLPSASASPPSSSATKATATTSSKPTQPNPNAADPSPSSEAATTAQLRLEVAEAIRGRGQAQTRLKAAETELSSLRTKGKRDAKQISKLTAERTALTARVRDLNEELDKKKTFLKDIQDDNLALNMELEMTIQKTTKVQAENKELVDRWMKRMGHEADALNRQNETPTKQHR